MLKDLVVQVSQRAATGKNESRRLRAQGQIPGVVYGENKPPVSIAVDRARILEILRSDSGENTLFTLHLQETDARRVVMIRDYQRDPVKGRLVHVDFVRIDLTKPIEVRVPIQVVGIPVGVKAEGGLLDHVVRDVSVSCLPTDIPESIELEVSTVHVGQHLSVKDLSVSEKVRILDDPEQTIVVVALPRAEVAAATEVEAAPAEEPVEGEPEVIKKGKEGAEEAPEGEAKKGKEGGKA